MPSITPSGVNFDKLQHIRLILIQKHRRPVKWNEVLDFVFDAYGQFKELQRENHRLTRRIKDLEDEYNVSKDQRTEFAENIALTLASRPAQPTMMQFSPQMSQQAAMMPPPPPIKPPRPIQQLSGNVKKDYKQEIKNIFTGDILLPSQISELNGFNARKEVLIEEEDVPLLTEHDLKYYDVPQKPAE